MWIGLALLIASLGLAAASGVFTKQRGREISLRHIGNQRLQRVAKVMFLCGMIMWLFGALMTAGSGK